MGAGTLILHACPQYLVYDHTAGQILEIGIY